MSGIRVLDIDQAPNQPPSFRKVFCWNVDLYQRLSFPCTPPFEYNLFYEIHMNATGNWYELLQNVKKKEQTLEKERIKRTIMFVDVIFQLALQLFELPNPKLIYLSND